MRERGQIFIYEGNRRNKSYAFSHSTPRSKERKNKHAINIQINEGAVCVCDTDLQSLKIINMVIKFILFCKDIISSDYDN